MIQKSDKHLDCTVALGTATRAMLHITDIADDYSSKVTLPAPGQTLSCYVVSLKANGKSAVVSTRPSRVAPDAATTVTDPRLLPSPTSPKAKRCVASSRPSPTSVFSFQSVASSMPASKSVNSLTNSFATGGSVSPLAKSSREPLWTSTWSERDRDVAQVHPWLHQARAEKAEERAQAAENKRPKRLTDFKVGDKVKGFIKNIIDFGVFVQIDGTNVSGLAHMNELSDGKADEALKAFRVGDKVRAIVLRINEEKRKISFGLKPSYFDAADFEDSSDEEEDDEEVEAEDEDIEEDEEDVEDEDEDEEDSDDEGDFVEMEEDDEDEDDETEATTSKKSSVPSLALSGGFSWSAGANDDEESDAALSGSDSDSDSDDSDSAARKASLKKEKAKSKAKSRKNANLEEDLTADLASKAPESTTDFERLLLGSPNSSFLWIQFMSFALQLSDVDKAREIARRALKVINYREEQERMNVWIALLNLENTYGSEETLEATFKEAVQANDGFTMYLKMVNILEAAEKIEAAEEMFVKAKTKYSTTPEFWIEYARFFLRTDQADASRALLPRAMQALAKRDHTSTITAFAINEFKLGDAERGRTIFEGLVDSYQKRLDLWWQYIDQESRLAENQAQVRNLFERTLTLKLTAKKGKSLLKKWLEYEKKQGDAKSQAKVLKKAKEFVEEINRRMRLWRMRRMKSRYGNHSSCIHIVLFFNDTMFA